MSHETIYRIIFHNEGKIYEIYARQVYQGEMYGFIEVEDLLFGEKTSLVVDPAEERLKTEFADTTRTFIPMHAIVRIDEVEKQGTGKITQVGDKDSNVTHFPSPIYTPRNDSNN